MATDDVHWASVPGLRAAADRIEAEAGRVGRILSDLHTRTGNNLVNPETFGTDHGGAAFFTKWESDVSTWDEGVRGVVRTVSATGTGVGNMADAYDRTDKDTTQMAHGLGQSVGGGGTPGLGGTGGVSNVPPLTPPSTGGGGGTGGGNTGGGNTRR
ncbi:hypothetical protein LFM09_44765 [Lentzea alba]|uniref:WXG100 family type VII secretion target n=1 Tax=Lentzea alba TaxID=2714351 RepID=UPI0039BEFAD1